MDEIKLVYVDDELDPYISKYLKKEYKKKPFIIHYNEVTFNNCDGYDSLLLNKTVTEANVILVDSKLFKNDRVSKGKFSGEEFKIILKKFFPFIEVIVITQNDLTEDYGTLSKYRSNLKETPQQYYEKKLKEELDQAIHNVFQYRNIADKLKINNEIDKVLIEKIINLVEGNSSYDGLTTSDIDKLIADFEELQELIGE